MHFGLTEDEIHSKVSTAPLFNCAVLTELSLSAFAYMVRHTAQYYNEILSSRAGL